MGSITNGGWDNPGGSGFAAKKSLQRFRVTEHGFENCEFRLPSRYPGCFRWFCCEHKSGQRSSLSDAVHHGPRWYGLYRPGLYLFFVGGGCAISEPIFLVTTLPNEPEIRLMGLSECVDPSVRSVRLRGGVKYRLPIPNNFGMGTRAAMVTDGPAKVFPVECGGWLSWLVDVMERKTELTTTEVGGGAVDV